MVFCMLSPSGDFMQWKKQGSNWMFYVVDEIEILRLRYASLQDDKHVLVVS